MTPQQIDGLRRIRDKGSNAWCIGGRAGGAIARMFYRLARAGYCSGPPFAITDKGRKALDAVDLLAEQRRRSARDAATDHG